MDQNLLDFDLDTDADADAADQMERECDARPTSTLTNSPGCAPAARISLFRPDRTPLRCVRTEAWSVPASTSWARPSRALRKVARRAVESEMTEPA